MPTIDHITYPDSIDGILSDHKLMRLFNQYIGTLRGNYSKLMFQFVQTPPNPTGMWQFLNSQSRGQLMLKITQEDRKKISNLKSQVEKAELDKEKEEWALNNWKGWADIRSNTVAAWTAEINTKWVPKFYESKAFQKHHHIANASGDSLATVRHAAKAIEAVTVTLKMMKDLGFTDVKNKKLQLALSAVAKSAALELDKPGKQAFAEVVKIEAVAKYKNYEDLAKAMKQKKVFV